MRALYTRQRNRRGMNAVEFALIATPLFLVVFGSIDYGWYFGVRHILHDAAYEGVRRGAVVAMPKDSDAPEWEVGGDPEGAARDAAAAVWASTGLPIEASFEADIVGTPPNAILTVTGTVTSPTLTGLTPVPDGELTVTVVKRMETQR